LRDTGAAEIRPGCEVLAAQLDRPGVGNECPAADCAPSYAGEDEISAVSLHGAIIDEFEIEIAGAGAERFLKQSGVVQRQRKASEQGVDAVVGSDVEGAGVAQGCL